MEKRDLAELFRQNAILALQLSNLEPEQLAKVTIYLPNALPPKFADYCDKVGLKKRPSLVVGALLDNDNPLATRTGEVAGNYLPFGNSVWLNSDVFKLFEANNPLGNYYVAHELGHAANGFSRRKFLGGAAAFIGAGVTGAGAWSLTGAALDAKPFAKRGLDIRDGATTLMQGAAAYVASKEVLKPLLVAYWPSLRADELSADDYAKKIVELHGVVYPQLINITADHKHEGSAIMGNLGKRFNEELAKQSHSLSTEEKNLCFALYVVKYFDRYRTPLSNEVLQDAYPDFVDRIRHQRAQIEQALDPKVHGRAL